MNSEELISIFALQQGTAVSNTKVPKARFLELPDVVASKKRLFSEDIEEVKLLAVYNEDTTRILSHKTNEVLYEEIYFFHVALKKDTHIGELNQLIQTYITNPAIIFYTYNDVVAISTAPKRLHKQETGKTVADKVYLTPWLNTSDSISFLQEGAITNCSFTHLERLYSDFTNYARHADLLFIVKDLNIDRRRDWSTLEPLIKQYQSLQTQKRRHAEDEQKHASFGEKLSMRSNRVAVEKELSKVVKSIQYSMENKT